MTPLQQKIAARRGEIMARRLMRYYDQLMGRGLTSVRANSLAYDRASTEAKMTFVVFEGGK